MIKPYEIVTWYASDLRVFIVSIEIEEIGETFTLTVDLACDPVVDFIVFEISDDPAFATTIYSEQTSGALFVDTDVDLPAGVPLYARARGLSGNTGSVWSESAEFVILE